MKHGLFFFCIFGPLLTNLFIMNIIKASILLFLFTIFSLNCFADSGCRIVFSGGVVRIFPTTPDPLGNSNYIVQNNRTTDCIGFTSSRRYVLSGEITTSTTVCTVSGQPNGLVATYPRYYDCPIDDYLDYSVIIFACTGFVLIRKQLA